MKRPRKRLAFIIIFLSAALLFLSSFFIPISVRRLDARPAISLRLEDRNGVLLREVLSEEFGRCRWVGLADISRFVVGATVASEDKHFLLHSGIDPYAVGRALLQNLTRRRVVSGASTISQQVIRNIYHFPRTLIAKLAESWLAIRLEHTMPKDAILVQYLNRVSYGNQTYGIEAASRLYFDKPSSDLSPAEAAFLSGIPISPSALNPYRNLPAALKKQKDILAKMAKLGFIDGDELDRALSEPLRLRAPRETFRAAHFCDYILGRVLGSERKNIAVVRTSLDSALEEKVEALIENHLRGLEKKGLTNAALLVMDNATGEILAMAGSRNFFDEQHDGQVNGTLSLRQPGSTLKPLTYALALEKGMTAATLLDDVATPITTGEGDFMPENSDGRYHGPIRLRSALASSYNVPAVAVLQTLGPDILYQRLKDVGFSSLKKSPDFYGVGLTLGDGEVTLLELVRAYATLARSGLYLPEKPILNVWRKDGRESHPDSSGGGRRVFSPEVTYIITHILADKDARIPTFGYNPPINFPFPAAAKTGTSKDFRDNWTMGFTLRYTVGVWVGNFDGTPMFNVSGITGAGPLFRDVMLLLEAGKTEERFCEPQAIVHAAICPLSGELSSPDCPGSIDEIFIQGTEPRKICSLAHEKSRQSLRTARPEIPAANGALVVFFPQDGDVFKLDPVLRRDFQSIRLKAAAAEGLGIEKLEFWINGKMAGATVFPYTLPWNLRPGFYTIKVRAQTKDGLIESGPVTIRIIS
jgi:penicillin-binding protein 1C